MTTFDRYEIIFAIIHSQITIEKTVASNKNLSEERRGEVIQRNAKLAHNLINRLIDESLSQ